MCGNDDFFFLGRIGSSSLRPIQFLVLCVVFAEYMYVCVLEEMGECIESRLKGSCVSCLMESKLLNHGYLGLHRRLDAEIRT